MQVAQRVLYAISPQGDGQDLILRVDVPVEIPKMGWGSQVSMGFITPSTMIYGADAWQSIGEAIRFIATRVGHYEENGWKFYWEKDGERSYAVDLVTIPQLPTPERTSSYEASTEEAPFTLEQNARFKQLALDRSAIELAKLDNSETDENIFVHLPRVAAAAYHLERFEDARQYAEKALSLAPSFEKNWNYGNAIHFGHTVLGLLAINQGDMQCAIEQLIKSGETPGSPQLNSFGPTMQLAKELLNRGEIQVALAYLNQCRRFWKLGDVWIDVWSNKILAGSVPNFFQHSYA